MFMVTLLFITGIIMIIKGGDWFVDSAIKIAKLSGLPEVLIGATLVSLATTLPEVTVSITAAIEGHTTMGIGNAVGSMICNIGLILAISVVFMPGKVHDKNYTYKALILITYTIILFVMAVDGTIEIVNSAILLGMLIIYLFINVREAVTNLEDHKGNKRRKISSKKEKQNIAIYFIVGIIAIILGSNLLIDNGVIIAEFIGVPEAVIGLTFIALGTSLPELTTGVASLIKKKPGIGLGNIIGANILNGCLVIGASGLFAPLEIIEQNIYFDFPVALTLSFILIIPTIIKKKTYRLQGIAFLIIYALYIGINFGNAL